jgi:predicted TIM-barrel fold metal-dependent hydrolase
VYGSTGSSDAGVGATPTFAEEAGMSQTVTPITPITIVSLDGHTQVPESAWAHYLEPRYHEYLPRLRDDNVRWIDVMGRLMVDRVNANVETFDLDGVYRAGGLAGIFDLDERLRQMDREGIAGEMVYNGEPRITGLFFQQTNGRYPDEVCEAGARAFHRYVHDTFGPSERLLLTGVTGHAPCRDMEATLAETRWIADHGFVGTMAPGSTAQVDGPPLYDEYWDPLWALCAEAGLTIVVHAGYGTVAGPFFEEISSVYDEMQRTGEPTEVVMERFNTTQMVAKFFDTIGTRKPLWQFTLGGVFDRHPDLRVLLTEIRADWQPALLAHLDAAWEANRESLPATRRPSEYWESNCTTCLSFAHRAEVELRHEIGIDTVTFGRDYPHPEGTWPNTTAWIRDAFAGVPETELRMMLGGNGPTFEQLMGPGPSATPELLDHFEVRGGYLKPAEADARLPESAPAVDADLAVLAGRAR